MLASTRQYQSSDSRLALSPRSYPARTFAGVLPPHYHGRLDVLLCGNGPWCRPCFLDSNDQRNLATNRPTCIYWLRACFVAGKCVSMTLSFFVPACISILLASHVATKRPIFVTINAPFFLDSLKGCFIGLFVPLTLYFMVTTPLTIMVDMKREAMEPSTVCGLLLTLLVFIKGSIASVFSAVCTLQCLAHITTGDRPSSGRAFRLMFSHKGAYIATLFLLVSALVSLIDLPLDMVTPVFASIGSYMVLILFCNRA